MLGSLSRYTQPFKETPAGQKLTTIPIIHHPRKISFCKISRADKEVCYPYISPHYCCVGVYLQQQDIIFIYIVPRIRLGEESIATHFMAVRFKVIPHINVAIHVRSRRTKPGEQQKYCLKRKA